LRAVPDSRLLLKSAVMVDMTVRQALLQLLVIQGIDSTRIDIDIWQGEVADHFAAYNRVDIALDPFPYNGTTATCEALWMGVPVVALIGDRHSGRVGFDILTRAGLPHLALPDPEDYIRKAAELARDLPALSALRQGLRARLRDSPLCDEKRFAREFEAALRQMWRLWCASPV
jgi:predicted O-linked N-acetylglucosamine transferase (SPINDLY family)